MTDILKRKINLDSSEEKGQSNLPPQYEKKTYNSTYPFNHPLNKFRQYMLEDLIGGPKLLKLNWVINFMKGLTPLYIVIMMNYYQNFSLGSTLYLVIHGTYGIVWFLKDCLFPDKSFQVKQTIFSTILAIISMSGYLSIGWQIFSGRGIQNPSLQRIATSLTLYIFGVCLMLVADAQKFYTLKYRSGLISEGVFALNRNPNYLGEICLYSSFSVLAGVWQAWIPNIFMWSSFFVINMYLKDISISRKPGGTQYIENSYLLIFKILEKDVFNIIFYCSITALVILQYYLDILNSFNQKI